MIKFIGLLLLLLYIIFKNKIKDIMKKFIDSLNFVPIENRFFFCDKVLPTNRRLETPPLKEISLKQ